MTPSEALTTTNPYALSSAQGEQPSIRTALARLAPFMAGEYGRLTVAFVATIVASATGLLGPVIIARVVDVNIRSGDFAGVLRWAALLLGLYAIGLVATYVQTLQMGKVGRFVLFNLRNGL